MSAFVEVAVPVPLRTLFTYRLPPELAGQVQVGSRVAVPFSRRKVAGIAMAFRDEAPSDVRRVLSVAGPLGTGAGFRSGAAGVPEGDGPLLCPPHWRGSAKRRAATPYGCASPPS